MMKKILIFLLILATMSQCSSRKKSVRNTEIKISEVLKTDTNTVVSAEDKAIVAEKVNKVLQKKEQENVGDVVIKGKTDSAKDFRFHNIVKGDTLADIYISGNADFTIVNRWKENKTEEKQISEIENLNIIAKVARKAVAATTIKENATSIREAEKSIKATGFSLPIYLIGGGAVVLLILLYFFFGDVKKFVQKLTDRNI